jgi:hypothetical protein
MLVPSIKRIQIKPFRWADSYMTRLASYCMKGYAQAPKLNLRREDLWAIFPS